MNRYTVFAITILLGFLAAVYYGWAARPVAASNVAPSLLRQDFRADFVLMVAEAYQADQDPERAISSLGFLRAEGEPYNPVGFVSQAMVFGAQNGYSPSDLNLLQALEQALLAYDPRFAATPTP